MHPILKALQGGIVVSVQAGEGEPLNTPQILCAMAESTLSGGAIGLRMAQANNIRYFKEKHPEIPVIGITKPPVIPPNAMELVYITPTFSDLLSLSDYCDIVALDATLRPRTQGETLEQIVRKSRESFPHLLLMADVSSLSEGLHAAQLGFDLISTTLSGYTMESRVENQEAGKAGPDFELLSALVEQTKTPIVLEGRIWEPQDVRIAFSLGAHCVVIGSAITRPHEITRRFVHACRHD